MISDLKPFKPYYQVPKISACEKIKIQKFKNQKIKNQNFKNQKIKNQNFKNQKIKNQNFKNQKIKNQNSKNTKKFPYMEILNKEIHVTQISLNGNFGLHNSYTSFPKWK